MVLVARDDDGRATVRVSARAGLVGNPSDGFGGAVLAAPLPGRAATVVAVVSDGLRHRGDSGTAEWGSVDDWLAAVARDGHGDEQRIISAALWTLVDHLRARGVPHDGVDLRWTTDVPRSVGLAGSSALTVGVIAAAAAVWDVVLDPRVVAALALRAERDVLGIAAGWQDRIVQAHGSTVLVDAARTDEIDGLTVPAVTVLAPPPVGGPVLVVGWAGGASESSDTYHAPLRRSAEALAAPMAELAGLARDAADAWARGDLATVAAAMERGWRTRQACAPLRPDHTALVESVRAAGVAATTPGSGGSVVALCLDEQAVRRASSVAESSGGGSLVVPIG